MIKERKNKKMKKTISMISEEFENEQTGEKVEGITIMIDGILKEFFNIMKIEQPSYENNLSIMQDLLMKGLESMRDSIQKSQ